MKSWNEIRKAATAFSKRWKDACDENRQAKSFLKEFFAVFGVDAVMAATHEYRAKFTDNSQNYTVQPRLRSVLAPGRKGKEALRQSSYAYKCAFMAAIMTLVDLGIAASVPKLDAANEAMVDELATLYRERRVSTPEYLFNTVVTNEMYDPSAKTSDWRYSSVYDERYRCFVDLNQDGHEDLIISEPTMQRGSGGLSYGVYLWTNGNYRAIGSIGTHPAFLYVEHIDCTQRTIWTYWHSSGISGSIGAFRVSSSGFATETHIDVDLGGEGRVTPTIGSELYELIRRKANVPIRTEISCTTNNVVRWRKFNMAKEYR